MDYPILTPSQLSQHLRALRKARGLSQSELGKRLGLSQSRIARMEASVTHISVDALLLLLSALDAQMVLTDGTAAPAALPVTSPASSAKGDW